MGESKGIWLRKEVLDLGLSLTHTAIISMAIDMPNNLHASNRSIAKMLNTSSRTVIRTIADLQNKGLISITGNTSARVITAKMAQVGEPSYSQYGLSTTANMAHTSAILSPTTANMADNIKDNKNKKEYIKKESVFLPYLEKWNSIETLPTHSEKVIKNGWKTKHDKLLKLYNKDSILSAIESYGICYRGENYWFSHRYTFIRFIEKMETFMPDMKPLENYKIKSATVKQDYNQYAEIGEALCLM